ncbi:MAG: DoxX family membrane protein [Cytophagales bacterium]|nr:DoxX family membrane protein [Cytophagales bacterium]
MKIAAQFSRYFVGVLFIISGVIKLNDPVGTQIKLEEYFEVFGTHFMVPFALYLAVFVCVLEVALGVAVLLWYRMKYTSMALLGLIIFFTFLTFYSAYFNKVTDCGCFGDALKLKPWQSFWKDIVLLVLIMVINASQKSIKSNTSNILGDSLVVIFTAIALGFAIYCIQHLSVIDFRAYKVGADIRALMQPSCAAKYKYVMTRSGQEYEFEKYPTDTTYTFKEMVLLNPECMPKITDYNIWSDEGDYTKETFNGKKIIITVLNTSKASINNIDKIKNLIKDAEGTDIQVIFITASDKQSFEDFRHEYALAAPYYYADAVVIKTMIRSNPGIIYLENGVIKGKWHENDTPNINNLPK